MLYKDTRTCGVYPETHAVHPETFGIYPDLRSARNTLSAVFDPDSGDGSGEQEFHIKFMEAGSFEIVNLSYLCIFSTVVFTP
jgi:hypothetical protein